MTENIPQATEPAQQPAQGTPQYAPAPDQPHAYPQPYGVPTERQWGPTQRPASSGFRVAAGIIGIVLGAWLFLPAVLGFAMSGPIMAFLVLVSSLGSLTAGIVLLANQRRRNQGPPVTALSFAGLALLLGVFDLVVPFTGPGLILAAVFLALPLIIVMGIGLSKEKRSA